VHDPHGLIVRREARPGGARRHARRGPADLLLRAHSQGAVDAFRRGEAHGLANLLLHDRDQPRRRCNGHQPGSAPERSPGRHDCGSGLAGRTGDDQEMTEIALVGIPGAAAERSAHRSAVQQAEADVLPLHSLRRNADIRDPHRAGAGRSGVQHQPAFGQHHGHGKVGAHRRPHDFSRVGIHACGDVNGHDRPAGAVDPFHRGGIAAPQRR
jgi:hypothetical protein